MATQKYQKHFFINVLSLNFNKIQQNHDNYLQLELIIKIFVVFVGNSKN